MSYLEYGNMTSPDIYWSQTKNPHSPWHQNPCPTYHWWCTRLLASRTPLYQTKPTALGPADGLVPQPYWYSMYKAGITARCLKEYCNRTYNNVTEKLEINISVQLPGSNILHCSDQPGGWACGYWQSSLLNSICFIYITFYRKMRKSKYKILSWLHTI